MKGMYEGAAMQGALQREEAAKKTGKIRFILMITALELMPGFMEFLQEASSEEIELKLTDSSTFGAVVRGAMDRDVSLALYPKQFELSSVIAWAESKDQGKF